VVVEELSNRVVLDNVVLDSVGLVVVLEDNLVDVGGIKVTTETAAVDEVVGIGRTTDVVVGTGTGEGLGAQSAKGSCPSQP
jgi:hypothetical protein